MDWLAVIMNIVNRVPIERVLFRPPDHFKALQDFAKTLPPTESPKEAPPEQKTTVATKTPEKVAQAVSTSVLERPGPTTEETIAHHNRQLGKQLNAMARHYTERMIIAGKPCDCGSSKHLLDIEQLSEETIPMVSDPTIYYEMMKWVKEVEPKSTDEAAKSGKYYDEYPILSRQARDLRKRLLGSLSLLSMVEPEEPLTLDQAKNIAAEEAQKEVGKRWESQEKK